MENQDIQRKYCPLIKEDCKCERCVMIGLDDMCLVVRGLLSLSEIDARLKKIGNVL